MPSLTQHREEYEGDLRGLSQLYAYDANKAADHCPVVCSVWEYLKAIGATEGIVDSRVHMLFPGMYPAIPGWHMDEVHRDEHGILRPDLTKPKVHYLLVLDQGTGSLPIFGNLQDNSLIRPGMRYSDLKGKVLPSYQAEPEKLYRFEWHDIHRATPAKGKGWRYFLRITLDSERSPLNEIRTQTQVYLTDENKGW